MKAVSVVLFVDRLQFFYLCVQNGVVGEDSNDDDNRLSGYTYIRDIRAIATGYNSVVSLSTGLRFI